ncbi:regulatory protein GemA [Ochrobactrum sp. MR28]|nr:regulatory protein GemA [Ochrobactrum sp. MR28]MBX8817997.1 regulatory protein GemA [Ochrobactrum sp. MR31]
MSTLALLHVAKKQLGLDEEDFRDVCERVTGKRSTKDMSEPLRIKLAEHFRQQGFNSVPKGTRKQLEGKYAAKLQALWIACWNLGIIRNKSDQALLAFVKRQTGVDHTRFLTYDDDARKVIEALKAMMTREAGVNWSVDKFLPDWANEPHGQIVLAQWSILRSRGLTDDNVAMSATIWPMCGYTGRPILSSLKSADWQLIMNKLGIKVRNSAVKNALNS